MHRFVEEGLTGDAQLENDLEPEPEPLQLPHQWLQVRGQGAQGFRCQGGLRRQNMDRILLGGRASSMTWVGVVLEAIKQQPPSRWLEGCWMKTLGRASELVAGRRFELLTFGL